MHENPFSGWQHHLGSCVAWGSLRWDLMSMCGGHLVTGPFIQIRSLALPGLVSWHPGSLASVWCVLLFLGSDVPLHRGLAFHSAQVPITHPVHSWTAHWNEVIQY